MSEKIKRESGKAESGKPKRSVRALPQFPLSRFPDFCFSP